MATTPTGATPVAGSEVFALTEAETLEVAGAIWSNTMMSDKDVAECNATFFAANTGITAKGKFILAYTLACADQGSSQATALQGEDQGVRFSAMSAHILQSYGTIRQYCMYFAKVVWNTLLKAKRAPASWQRRHYDAANRYAAFDFFQGVLHEGGLKPKEGLIRKPTASEILANEANREISITTSQAEARFTTHGQMALREQQSASVRERRLLM